MTLYRFTTPGSHRDKVEPTTWTKQFRTDDEALTYAQESVDVGLPKVERLVHLEVWEVWNTAKGGWEITPTPRIRSLPRHRPNLRPQDEQPEPPGIPRE